MRKTMTAGLLALGLLAMPAKAAWFEARSDHFIVYAQGGADEARNLAIDLERFDKGMRLLRSMPADPIAKVNPLTIFVVQDLGAVRRLCGQAGRTVASCANVAGFYDGRAAGSIAVTPRVSVGGTYDISPQIVLFHEYSHHMMFRYFAAAYPAWFVEGFAEFNSTAKIEKDGQMGLGSPALHRAYGLMLGTPLPIRKLLTARGPELNPEDREKLYGRGWLLCHYLAFTPERRGQLDKYLNAVATGTPSLKAAEDAFGNLTQLDRALDVYMKSRTWRTLMFSEKETAPDEVKVRQLGEGESAMMPVRIRSQRGVDQRAAQDVVKAARTIAASFPKDPAVQDALAEAEFDAGETAQARAAADRALAADASDRTAMLYEGRSRMAEAIKQKKFDAKTWSDVRSWFVKANRAEPNAAAPLMLFYVSFLAQHVKPTANAVTGLEQAQAIAPEADDLRMLLARQYLLDDRKPEARAILLPLAFNPHADADNPAAKLVATIDAGDDAALKALLTPPPSGDQSAN